MSTFTPLLNLELVDFNVITWHDQVNNNFSILDSAAGGANQARYSLYASGILAGAELLLRYIFTDEILFPVGLTNSKASAIGASSGTVAFSLKKNGVEFGTITFSISATGVFAAPLATTFVIGDILTIVAPVTPDAGLSGVSITLAGSKSS